MSLNAAQFRLSKNPTNCLLLMNKSARRTVFCTISKTWQIGLPQFGVKIQIISLLFEAYLKICSRVIHV